MNQQESGSRTNSDSKIGFDRTKSLAALMASTDDRMSEDEMRKHREQIMIERDRIKKSKGKEECEICQKKLKGLMTKSKYCVFCNRYICSEHVVKKREDPGVPGEFVEICGQCEDKILYEKLMKKYSDAEAILEEREQKYTAKLAQVEEQLKNNQEEYEKLIKEVHHAAINNQQEQAKAIHDMRIQKYSQLLIEAQTRLKELEEEAETLHNHNQRLIDRNKQIEAEKAQYQAEYEQAKNESQALTYQLSAIELDIKQVTYVINEAEKKIARHKIGLQQAEATEAERNQLQQQQQQAGVANSYAQGNSILRSLNNNSKFNEKANKKDEKDHNKAYYCV